jgi:hypothetical protein
LRLNQMLNSRDILEEFDIKKMLQNSFDLISQQKH